MRFDVRCLFAEDASCTRMSTTCWGTWNRQSASERNVRTDLPTGSAAILYIIIIVVIIVTVEINIHSGLYFIIINSIFGKLGRTASDEVIVHLVHSKCLPALLYRLEVCPLTKTDYQSLDFVVMRFLMKLFCTSNSVIAVSYTHLTLPTKRIV